VVVTVVGDEIRVRSMTGAMSELQADAARFLQNEQTSVDVFLADRLCLALGARVKAPALTTDRPWNDIADAVGTAVELIR